MIRIYFDADTFYSILHNSKTSANKLGTPSSDWYIGWSNRTIRRSAKIGYMSEGLYNAIMSKIDISSCVICRTDSNKNAVFPRLDFLETKMAELEKRIEVLES